MINSTRFTSQGPNRNMTGVRGASDDCLEPQGADQTEPWWRLCASGNKCDKVVETVLN